MNGPNILETFFKRNLFISLDKKWFGLNFGQIFVNSSGNPVSHLNTRLNFMAELFKGFNHQQTGTDVMIFKIFLLKNRRKNWRF
jgi:hypothetical protein